MPSPSLSQLRESLAALQSYNLPERYEPFTTDGSGCDGTSSNDNGTSPSPSAPGGSITATHENTQPLLDAEILARYRKARENYLRSRINDLFIQHLSTIKYDNDGTGNGTGTGTGTGDDGMGEPTIELPTIEPAEMEEVAMQLQTIKGELRDSVCKVKGSYEEVYRKYQSLEQKREELSAIISDLEKKESSDVTMGNDTNQHAHKHAHEHKHENDNEQQLENRNDTDNKDLMDVDDDTMQQSEDLQDEEIKSLMAKRSELEARLRKVRMDTEETQSRIVSKKEQLKDIASMRSGNNSINNSNGSTNEDIEGDNSPTTVMESSNVQEIEQEIAVLRKQASDFADMSEYYESMRTVLEELSGIKIISITDVNEKDSEGGASGATTSNSSPNSSHSSKSGSEISNANTSPSKISPRKLSPRQKKRRSLAQIPSPSDQVDSETICMKALLLKKHIVNITLTSSGKSKFLVDHDATTANSSQDGSSGSSGASLTQVETFRVTDAKLQTSSIITDAMTEDEDRENNPMPTVSIAIPPLEDLVSLSVNLEPLQGLRFVLRETLARIRTLTARLEELSILRRRYLTKITDPSKNKLNYGFGGEDQEVVCSLNSQVTVVMRLTADCPILKSSAYIHHIVGLGGWDNNMLQRIKTKVNDKQSRSPVDVMDLVVEEITKTGEVPKTPSLPKRRK